MLGVLISKLILESNKLINGGCVYVSGFFYVLDEHIGTFVCVPPRFPSFFDFLISNGIGVLLLVIVKTLFQVQ